MTTSAATWFDTVVQYATKDARVAILLVVLLVGIALWLLDLVAGLAMARVPLDERQRAWLALAAPYFEVHGFRSGDLGGVRPLGRLRIRVLLRKDWGVRDRDGAVRTLAWLLEAGHRQDPRYRDPNQPAAALAIVDRSLLAWDGIRVIWLARCCYAVGYLDEAMVWHFVTAAIRLVRGRFQSWAEWGRSFAAGRVIWARGASSYYETKVEDLLRKPGSVWNRTPWQIATQP